MLTRGSGAVDHLHVERGIVCAGEISQQNSFDQGAAVHGLTDDGLADPRLCSRSP